MNHFSKVKITGAVNTERARGGPDGWNLSSHFRLSRYKPEAKQYHQIGGVLIAHDWHSKVGKNTKQLSSDNKLNSNRIGPRCDLTRLLVLFRGEGERSPPPDYTLKRILKNIF